MPVRGDWLVVDAVCANRSASGKLLLTGRLTGRFQKLGQKPDSDPTKVQENEAFAASFPRIRNRETNVRNRAIIVAVDRGGKQLGFYTRRGGVGGMASNCEYNAGFSRPKIQLPQQQYGAPLSAYKLDARRLAPLLRSIARFDLIGRFPIFTTHRSDLPEWILGETAVGHKEPETHSRMMTVVLPSQSLD
jgi:hypothetical protein